MGHDIRFDRTTRYAGFASLHDQLGARFRKQQLTRHEAVLNDPDHQLARRRQAGRTVTLKNFLYASLGFECIDVLGIIPQ